MKLRGNLDVKGAFRTKISHFRDQKSSTINGGTLTEDAWNTRTLNNTVINNILGCSLSSNQVTLPAGAFYIEATTPGFRVDEHKCRIQNITAGTTLIVGTSEFCDDADAASTVSTAKGVIFGPVVIEVQHWIGNTTTVADGGNATSIVGVNEVCTELLIEKL